MNCIPGLVHFDKPLTIPALLDLFRNNFDDRITIRSSKQVRLFSLGQCEKNASTRHIVLSPTVQIAQNPGNHSYCKDKHPKPTICWIWEVSTRCGIQRRQAPCNSVPTC